MYNVYLFIVYMNNIYIYIYIYLIIYYTCQHKTFIHKYNIFHLLLCMYSGGRLCTLIGVPWRGESAEHAETAGYTYEGTQSTA